MQDNKEGRFYMHSREDTEAGRSADLYFEVKLVNEVRGSVLNQEIHSAAWFSFCQPRGARAILT